MEEPSRILFAINRKAPYAIPLPDDGTAALGKGLVEMGRISSRLKITKLGLFLTPFAHDVTNRAHFEN